MTKYHIYEEGVRFATIVATDADTALYEADRDFPRTRSDYNMEEDDLPWEIEWTAFVDGERYSVGSRMVTVPSEEMNK